MNDLLKAQNETVLALVNEIFLKGEFLCPVELGAVETAAPIGELSDYEKAIILAHTQVVKMNNNAIHEAEKKGEKADEYQNYLNKNSCDALNHLFWFNLRCHFAKVTIEGNRLRICKDWKVAIAEKSEQASLSLQYVIS